MGRLSSATINGITLTEKQMDKANTMYQDAIRKIPANANSVQKMQMTTEAAQKSILATYENKVLVYDGNTMSIRDPSAPMDRGGR